MRRREVPLFNQLLYLHHFILHHIFSLGDAIAIWQLALPKAELNTKGATKKLFETE